MWLKELGEIYSEGWNPGGPNLPGDSKATFPPQETRDSLRMRGVFGAGDSPASMYSNSLASGQNPYEQEEDQMISKNTVLKMIDTHIGHLDSANRLDQSGVLHLGKLKNEIKGL